MAKHDKKKLVLSVVGMNYRVTPDTMRKLRKDLPLRVRLEREPTNAHDENAVRVIIAGQKFHIGYLSRVTAKELAPRMDEGGWWSKPFKSVWLTEIELDGTGELTFRRTEGEPPTK